MIESRPILFTCTVVMMIPVIIAAACVGIGVEHSHGGGDHHHDHSHGHAHSHSHGHPHSHSHDHAHRHHHHHEDSHPTAHIHVTVLGFTLTVTVDDEETDRDRQWTPRSNQSVRSRSSSNRLKESLAVDLRPDLSLAGFFQVCSFVESVVPDRLIAPQTDVSEDYLAAVELTRGRIRDMPLTPPPEAV